MRVRTWAAVVSLCVALASCGASSDGTQSTAPETIAPPSATAVEQMGGQSITYDDTQRLSKMYTTLLRTKDKEGFLATFVPSARGAREQMGHWFDNLQKLGATHLSLSFIKATRARDSSGKENLAADMGLILQIPGVDPVPLSEWYSFTFAPKTSKGELKVLAVKGASADRSTGEKYSRYYRQAWDDGPMAVVRGERAVLIGPTADERWMRANLARFDAGVRSQVDRVVRAGITLPRDAATRSWLFTIQSPSVKDVFDYLGGKVDRTEAHFAGFTQAMYAADAQSGVFDRDHVATSRIVIAREAMNDPGLAVTIRHEMTHAVQQSWQGESDRAPTWIVEGLAVFLQRPPASEVSFRTRAGLAYLRKAKTMPDRDFYEGNDEAVGSHYGAGYLGVAYLADRMGEKKLLTTIRELENTSAPLEEVFGMDEMQIAKGAIAWAS
ncbi:MAG: hypothetical protein JWQ91_2118 [Aeromicrobium sp.]|uniref:hypothetical protein n=1 Tax=Aeromicrobium sp. TaxID=1871063 RepID=UPI002607BAFB|nr:hypothetical protein [Aeromicrobium sp.]MCW2825201.1 hypothetical protein [Aeromicrobium sp.]